MPTSPTRPEFSDNRNDQIKIGRNTAKKDICDIPGNNIYSLVLSSAHDLEKTDSAYYAELLVSALLGSIYSVAHNDRVRTVERFASGFHRYLSMENTRETQLLHAVLDALIPSEDPAPTPDTPPWARYLGKVTLTGSFEYGDIYGDQVNYVSTFAYPEEEIGGPEHVISVLVDRNYTIIKDLFVAAPASAVIDQLRASATDDDRAYFTEIDPALLRQSVMPYITADSVTATDEGSFITDRAIAVARLRILPPQAPSTSTNTSSEDPRGAFRTSPEADALIVAPGDETAMELCLELLYRYILTQPDRDPLRWSPTLVRLFLLEWMPRETTLTPTHCALLLRVLDAWVRWAGRLRALPPCAVASTILTIAETRRHCIHRCQDSASHDPQA